MGCGLEFVDKVLLSFSCDITGEFGKMFAGAWVGYCVFGHGEYAEFHGALGGSVLVLVGVLAVAPPLLAYEGAVGGEPVEEPVLSDGDAVLCE